MTDVLASRGVVDLVRERGGRLFVWTSAHRCCGGGLTSLATGGAPEPGRTFRRVDADGFELYLDPGRMGPPDALHLELKGLRRKRIEAYWNGCAFVA
jgi:hypothetical protein